MKKVLCLIFVLLILFCGCSHDSQSDQLHTDTLTNDDTFIRNENGNIVSDLGVEYAHLANEGFFCYLGDLEFVGSIQGEEKTSQHLGLSYQTGMFAIKNAENDNIRKDYVLPTEWLQKLENK